MALINRHSGGGDVIVWKTKLPIISILLMAIFLVGGSVILISDWPPGPANLDWGVWILTYFGYLYVIAASVFYVLKGK